MIIPDASIIVELLLGTPHGLLFADRVLDEGETLHAPHVIDLEVVHALRSLAWRGEVSHERASVALPLFLALPISRYSHEPLLPRIWQLRANLSPYDAAYVVLSEGLDGTLITHDARLAATSGHRAKIEVV